MSEIILYRGDTATLSVAITDATGAAYDLTNHTATFTVREYEDASTILLQKVTPTEITILAPPEGGEMEINIDAGDTSDFWGKKMYDLEIQAPAPGSEVYTVSKGYFTILKDVTHA